MASVTGEEFDKARGFFPSLIIAAGGSSALRYFRVDTNDFGGAMQAIGLPQLGDALPNYPNLVVTSLEPKFEGGEHSVVEVRYQDRVDQGFDLTVEPGEAYLEFNDSLREIPIRYDINGEDIPETTVERSTGEITVKSYKASLDPWFNAWADIRNKINANQVALPPPRGLGVFTIVPQGWLLARTFALRPVRDGVVEVSFTFGIAPPEAWRFEFAIFDPDGEVQAISTPRTIYHSTPYPSPGVLW